ncbi:MAG TPA: hypothetical protein DEB74_17750 [Lachnospiraceae bacterium]|nr:hypothetical protein [Lachnospiraceae bacterium]
MMGLFCIRTALYKESGENMFTISNIIEDIDRGCLANNMVEDRFSYRIIFFVNENGKGTKHYIDSGYGDLRKSLESIIRENLSVTNSIVLAAATTRKNGETVSLLSRSYLFNLDGYFEHIVGKTEKEYKIVSHGRRMAQGC